MSTAAVSATSNKCLVYGAGGVVQTALTKIPQKVPANHILVKVHAVGLNPVDAKHKIGDKFPSFLNSFSRRLVRGLTIGFEFSGTVAAADNDYSIGDPVFGSMPPLSGTLSEYIVAPKHQVYRKPSSWSFAQAACVPLVGLTAVQALQPYASSSSSIAIVGASGGVGHMALQVAKDLGFTTRIAVCSTSNMEFCKSLGATHVIDYTRNQVVQDLIDHIGGDEGVDIILDCVTSVEAHDAKHGYPQKLLPLCKTKYIRLGGPTIGWFYAGCERLINITCFWGKDKLFWIRFPHSSDELSLLAEWCNGAGREGKKLQPHISNPFIDFSAEAVQQAFDTILGRHVKGKLVVEIVKTDDPVVG